MKAKKRDEKGGDESESKVSPEKISLLKKSAFAAILVIFALAMFTAVASADDPPCNCGDICVNETGWWRDGGDFNTSNTPIQHAIDNATAGETICVKDGAYTENVDVDKGLTIKSENGYASTIVTALDPNDHIFCLPWAADADWVNISGFTVTGADWRAGIYLSGADHCNISDNNASGNYHGIYLSGSNNNSITNNIANSNVRGIYIGWSSYNIVDSNTVNDNDCVGIAIDSCFLGGTKILLADSSYKNIEDVEVGDFVQSYDEAKKEMVTGKVLKTFYHEKTDYYLVINEKLRLTPNHPMYVNNEWKEAGDIKIGDLLLDKDGNYVAVTSIEKIDESVPVYNLEVSGYHNYFAEDILTHNKCPLIFSYNGTGYQFDVMINVLAVGPEEDKLFEYPLKYLEEPRIRVEYDPKEINYIDFIKLIIEDTTEQEGLQNKTHLLDPISCSGTDFECNLSLLEERDGQYLISDVDHKEFFLEFEDFPELESEYNRTIKIFSSGYQIILDDANFSCECEQVEGLCEFLDEYFSENNKNPYSNRYGNENSYNTISNNEVYGNGFGDNCWLGNCGISLMYEDHTDITNNIVTENCRGIYLFYSSYNTIERNMIVNNTAGGTGVHITDYSDENEIHENCFIGNEPQAWDDLMGESNNWDRNYWSPPPGGPDDYTIPGAAGSKDNDPLDECPLGEGPPTPARVPALTPLGIIALVGLLSIVLAVSIRIRRKK